MRGGGLNLGVSGTNKATGAEGGKEGRDAEAREMANDIWNMLVNLDSEEEHIGWRGKDSGCMGEKAREGEGKEMKTKWESRWGSPGGNERDERG